MASYIKNNNSWGVRVNLV